jgi:hypothetical protein
MLREDIALYKRNIKNRIYIYILCEENTELFNVKASGTSSKHCLNG